MAHITKYGKANANGLFRHIERSNENYSNKNIDKSKTLENCSLLFDELTAHERYENRLNEIHVSKRNDVKTIASIVVTLPTDMLEKDINEQAKFWMATNEFLEKDFGKENVIYSQIHNDEITPHLHFGAIPVVWDENKEQYKCCAKEKLNKEYFEHFHDRLNDYVDKALGYHVEILKNDDKVRNRTIDQVKNDSELSKWERFTKVLEKNFNELKDKYKNIFHQFNFLKQQNENLKNENENLKNCIGELYSQNFENEFIINRDLKNTNSLKDIKENYLIQNRDDFEIER